MPMSLLYYSWAMKGHQVSLELGGLSQRCCLELWSLLCKLINTHTNSFLYRMSEAVNVSPGLRSREVDKQIGSVWAVIKKLHRSVVANQELRQKLKLIHTHQWSHALRSVRMTEIAQAAEASLAGLRVKTFGGNSCVNDSTSPLSGQSGIRRLGRQIAPLK